MARSPSNTAGLVPDDSLLSDLSSTSTSTSNIQSATSISNDVPFTGLCSFYVPNRIRVSLDCGTELVTKQEFKDECDINTILTQYKRTGIIQHIMAQPPVYGDLPEPQDYQTSLEMFRHAGEAFDALPAVVRRYFQNDPRQLLDALADPAMRPQLEELGILRGPSNPQPPGNVANRNPSLAPTLATTPELPPRSLDPAAPPAPSSPPSSPGNGVV